MILALLRSLIAVASDRGITSHLINKSFTQNAFPLLAIKIPCKKFTMLRLVQVYKKNLSADLLQDFDTKTLDPDGTRTHNLLIRSQTPYPLGH